MDDRLKQYIQVHRDDFDTENPGSHVLKNLRKKIGGETGKKKFFSIRSLQWAAVFAGILLASSIFYFGLRKNEQPVVVGTNPIEETGDIPSPLYAKQIHHFKELIELKRSELRQVEREHPELYKQFITDVHKLDSSYRFLKTKLTETPNQEMLLEAMIQNLQLQSDLLNQQLTIIKEIKQKSKSNEKVTI